MEEIKNKTVFIAPLDWGIGHATRCVPLIRKLCENNNKVIIGVTQLTREIFEDEFPDLEKIQIPGYNIRYSSVLPVWLKLLFDWKRISAVIKKESQTLKEIVSKFKVEIVISDNRFGLRSAETKNIFITHQLFLKTPFFNALAQYINKKYILDFDEVWVPDHSNETNSLGGKLSHGKHFHHNVRYIGPQSRLKKNDAVRPVYDFLFLISGPEPQNSILKKLLLGRSKQFPDLKFAFVCQSPVESELANVEYFVSPNAKNLGKIIGESACIVCRSGYSTLMDLYLLGKNNLILIPTPGQTEQEYLAWYWKNKFSCRVVQQNHIDSFNFSVE